MSEHCSHHASESQAQAAARSPRYRRVLWLALLINAAMFAIEIGGGWRSGSSSLLADAIDFFGDAANYGLALIVLGMATTWRARAAQLKAWSMGLFGLVVLGRAGWAAFAGGVPEAATMGLIGMAALVANLTVALLLYAWRDGDANMRSVWLCTRNDALGNLAVLAAALGVFGTHSAWPDLIVATAMGGLALSASVSVLRQARAELAHAHPNTH
ncbi:MAG TPA: cation transporter [Burkholderiaceae bacterium]